jgi:hypothetical protein
MIGRVPHRTLLSVPTLSPVGHSSRVSAPPSSPTAETKLAPPKLDVLPQRVCSNLCELQRIARESRPVSDPMTHDQKILIFWTRASPD